MTTLRIRTRAAAAGLAMLAFPMAGALAADGDLGGNRYFYERYYAGEMSVSQAYVEAIVKRGPGHGHGHGRNGRLTLVDVRDATEYRMGHPEGAQHVPFPRVYQSCKTNPAQPADPVLRSEDGGSCLYGAVANSTVSMTPEQFFLAMEALYPDKSTRIGLLCRTGSRSVRAGNILAHPEKFVGPAYAGRGYANVYNIWQGFVGQPVPPVHASTGRVLGASAEVTAVSLDGGATAQGFVAYKLDLNNDGVVDIKDNDGWRYHHALPYEERMTPRQLNATAWPYYMQP